MSTMSIIETSSKMMAAVRSGTSPYDFIEVMACPGGCAGGGGQPLGTTRAITKERIASLYAIDRSLPHRKSHENPVIQKLYERDLGAPLRPKAHDLLHTTYHEIPPACTF